MEDRIGHFLQFMSSEKGASENTIAAYRNDLTQFQTFLSTLNLNGNPTDWRRVSTDAVVSYVLDLKQRRYAEASVARKVAAVKSFFQFLQAEGTIQRNPTESLESPRVGKTLPKPLSVQEVDELLEQPAKRRTPEALRDRAMLELLYATGLRVTELVSLNLDSISMDPHHPSARCLGKGAKERSIPIHEQALRALVAYLNEGRGRLVKNKKERALFVNRRGERLTRQGFWLILKQYARQAGLQGTVTPHSLRHSFATHMLRGGAPLRNVQELLGHANISTTQVYTQITDEHVRRVYEQAHPRAK
ncbi:MAG: site-specific tyrosine recombinase XerD [Chloroflexi bacterium RBG_16_68_14]|nr:MAG: site-specific tyrosine recombinase XerD [Chloroflexi bacterium RBG_16_68_14]